MEMFDPEYLPWISELEIISDILPTRIESNFVSDFDRKLGTLPTLNLLWFRNFESTAEVQLLNLNNRILTPTKTINGISEKNRIDISGDGSRLAWCTDSLRYEIRDENRVFS